MPSKPERSPAGRFRSGSHPARRIPAELPTAAGRQSVEVQPAIVGRNAQPASGGRKAQPGPRFGNPPAAVVARGNLPKPGRRKAVLRPSVPAPRGNDRRPRTGLLALKAKVMLRGLAVANRRTKAARNVVKWRAELVAELGGEPGMTAPRLTPIETLFRTKLDGSPILPRIEPYRRRILTDVLDTADDAGGLRYNLALLGRAKKNAKSLGPRPRRSVRLLRE